MMARKSWGIMNALTMSSAARIGIVDFWISGVFGNDSSAIADEGTPVTTIRLAKASKENPIPNRVCK